MRCGTSVSQGIIKANIHELSLDDRTELDWSEFIPLVPMLSMGSATLGDALSDLIPPRFATNTSPGGTSPVGMFLV